MDLLGVLQEASGPDSLGFGPSIPECGPSSVQGMAPSPRPGLNPAPSSGPGSALPAASHSALGAIQRQLHWFQLSMWQQMESFARRIASQFSSRVTHASPPSIGGGLGVPAPQSSPCIMTPSPCDELLVNCMPSPLDDLSLLPPLFPELGSELEADPTTSPETCLHASIGRMRASSLPQFGQ